MKVADHGASRDAETLATAVDETVIAETEDVEITVGLDSRGTMEMNTTGSFQTVTNASTPQYTPDPRVVLLETCAHRCKYRTLMQLFFPSAALQVRSS
jgi:hypothetical protein